MSKEVTEPAQGCADDFSTLHMGVEKNLSGMLTK